ncbi:hypothetical protein [Alkalibacterium sp. 20]|nr:hypothetical protein [Alkalibacterium sp. 20]
MNKNVKITASIFGGMVIVGLFMFAAMNGMGTDDDVSDKRYGSSVGTNVK